MCEADLLHDQWVSDQILAQIPLDKRITTVVIAGSKSEEPLASMIAQGLETEPCVAASEKGWPSTFGQTREDAGRIIIVLTSLEDPEANEIIGQSTILKMMRLREVKVIVATLSDLRRVRKGLKVISINR